MKSLPESTPLPASPNSGGRNERISQVLSSAALSPDNMADDLYLPQSSSSHSEDNAPCTPPMQPSFQPLQHFRTTDNTPDDEEDAFLPVNLREHETLWKQDAEAEYARLRALIKQEQAKSEQKNSELRFSQEEYAAIKSQVEKLQILHERDIREKTLLQNRIQEMKQEIAQKMEDLRQSLLRDQETAIKARVQQVRSDHAQELDDLLKQLDLVEAEQSELVAEKETVISALGAQLADAERKLDAKSLERDSTSKRVEELEKEIHALRADSELKANEVERLISERARAAEDEAFIREQLCAEAREEIIQRAEAHFQELKHRFDKAQESEHDLEAKLKEALATSRSVQRTLANVVAEMEENRGNKCSPIDLTGLKCD